MPDLPTESVPPTWVDPMEDIRAWWASLPDRVSPPGIPPRPPHPLIGDEAWRMSIDLEREIAAREFAQALDRAADGHGRHDR